MSRSTIYEQPRVAPRPGETVVTSTCGHNCGGRCVVNAHVQDGRMVKISTDPRKWTPELPPLHACVRGFGQLERVYHEVSAFVPTTYLEVPRRGPNGRFFPIKTPADLERAQDDLREVLAASSI